MIKLGEFRKQKTKMSFKDWVKKYARDGVYRIRVIFPPRNYPSFSLIFEDENKEVKLYVNRSTFKEVMKALNIHNLKADLPSLVFVVENGNYGLAIEDDDDGWKMEWNGSYWIRKKDDIPF